MKKAAVLISTIALSAATCAYAQEGPGGRFGGGAGGPPSMEAPGGGGGGGSGPSLDGPSRGGGGGPAEALGNPGGGDGPRALERGAEDGGGRAERAARGSDDGPAERGPSRKSAQSERGDDAPKPRRERNAGDDSGPSKAERAAERAKSKAEDKADDASKRATTETKERAKEARESTPKAGDAAKPSDAAKADDAATTKDAAKADDTAKKGSDTARAAPERVKQVEIASDKRDRVDAAFRDRHDARRTDVNIDIRVGRRLPRDWHFVPVPIAVIEIVPEYRGYVYVWVEDEYVICDPDTYEVVAVIPAASSRQASAGGGGNQCPTRIRLSDDERELILQEVRMRDAIEVRDLDVGWSVPANIELERFPEPVLAEADELSGCRYFVAEDQLAIVDPEAEKVVLLIDRS